MTSFKLVIERVRRTGYYTTNTQLRKSDINQKQQIFVVLFKAKFD